MRSRGLLALSLALALLVQPGCVMLFLSRYNPKRAEPIRPGITGQVDPVSRAIVRGYVCDCIWILAAGVGLVFLVIDSVYVASWFGQRRENRAVAGDDPPERDPADAGSQAAAVRP